jgi:hypothetical protein
MKTITIRSDGPFKTMDVLRQSLELSPQQALNIDAIRRRCRVLDVMDKHEGDGPLMLEDADWTTAKQSLESFPFSIANKALLQIIDDVVGAADVAQPG